MSAQRTPPAPPPAPELVSLARLGLENMLMLGTVSLVISSAYPTGVPDRVRAAGPVYKLNVAHRMTPPINLQVHDLGFEADLSFGGVMHHVVVPYAAIIAAGREVGADLAPAPKHTRPNHLKLV